MGPDVPSPPGDSVRGPATVAVDSHRSGCGGQVQIPRRMCGAQVPGAPAQGALVLLAQYGGHGAGGALPGPENPPP